MSVPATGVLTPVTIPLPTFSGDCGGPLAISCDNTNGGNYPIGTTAVTCTYTPPSGPEVVCPITVTVFPPTTLDVTFTETPLVNPNPGTSIYEGASFGPFHSFYSGTDNFYVFKDGEFIQAIPAQGFVAANAAPIDTGVVFIGRNAADQYGTARIDFCGGVPSAVQFHTFTQQGFTFSQGVFWNGNSTGLICGATPSDGKVFRVKPPEEPQVFNLPAGSRAQDVFIDGNACVVLGTGRNGILRFEETGESLFIDLSWTPGSGTVAPNGNLYVTDAYNPKLNELTRDGQQVADFDLSASIFRISTLPNGDVFGLVPPRTFVVFDPDFGLEATHPLSGTGNNIVDFKPKPGLQPGVLVFLNDPTVGRSFVRTVEMDMADILRGQVYTNIHSECPSPALKGRLQPAP